MCAKIEHHTKHITYEALLQGNKDWVAATLAEDPEYFARLSAGQTPPVLWIGCSDSRVPANQITNTNPGDIFVHRNIANVVVHTDMNLLSVLDYAVNVLEVEHVIVCGHYGCGGVQAALGNKQYGIIDNWLRNIKDTYRLHYHELDRITDDKKRADRLVELNVIEGVFNLTKTSIIQNRWSNGKKLGIHGWVYSLETGLIKDLSVTTESNDNISSVFKIDMLTK
ncbi:carbonate dehydratase [Pedobacter antarcticus]|uniref:Carbonic anhydrase 2 n=2 Tax=Pedobacter antarcticus TaxID=34086 RepID=A0A081PGY3_9SPHI|nr:carbonate dehydratase [Pedobacter antarcticus]KEQ29956.1 carbonate dehydratase [Pedobacter antarcticus 4BY]SDM04094.1 carbonic anhydrase [Pedobacter antarcticus]SFF28508.1 carbonic anhydrase [Pedobacter antarcticus]